jgi:predicted DNA-binding transcriptional regulator YafY
MLRQQERILDLDALLRNRDRTTAQHLADELEVSERTVRADLEFLKLRLQAPIKYSKKLGFHYTDPSWRLSTYPLTQGEIFALTLGARMLKAYGGSAYRQELETAIKSLSDRLPTQTWVDLQKLAEEHVLFGSEAKVDLDPEVWSDLMMACHKKLSVQMTYYTASRNAASDRQFDPYLLHIYRGTNAYVIGYCHSRQMVRWFRVDRIRKLALTTINFTIPIDFDASSYLDNIFQCEVGKGVSDVVIYFDPVTAPYVRERRWHPSQEITEYADGSIDLMMTVSGLNDLKRWVLGYGRGAMVKRPPELVRLVRDEVAALAQGYLGKNQEN